MGGGGYQGFTDQRVFYLGERGGALGGGLVKDLAQGLPGKYNIDSGTLQTAAG